MKKHWLLMAATAASVSGCYSVESPSNSNLGSFRVVVQSISAVSSSDSLQPLSVVPSCIKQYGTRLDQVPLDVRGKEDCRYIVPNGQVELVVDVTALDKSGKALDFNGPVAFKVVPGDIADDNYTYTWTTLAKGRGIGKLRAQHVYGEVRVWALDEPVEPRYVDGGIAGNVNQLPVEPGSRTYAAGTSATLFFQEPTLAAVQQPQGYENRYSPFTGQFVTIGRAPESGSVQYQNCPDIDLNGDGKVDPQPAKPVTLLVTGTDPSGFFVTDLTSCPIPEDTSSAAQVNVPEPSGYLPGTYGSMFVYNYSFPEGLNAGDLLWTLSGSLQEFTSTTQLTFPSWTVREHVRELPPDQWNKYLKLNPPVELNLRHCGHKNQLAPQSVDTLCGYYNSNLKLESMESALVKLRRVRFPKFFKDCDLNGDGKVPFFCSSSGAWTFCGTTAPLDNNEVQCNIECTIGTGPYLNSVCTERTQYNSFGQFVVEMAGPGPRAAGLDDSLAGRWQEVLLSDTASAKTATSYDDGTEVSVWCDLDTYFRFGGSTVTAANTDELLPAKTRKDVIISGGKGTVAFLAQKLPAASTPAPRCYVSRNTHSRVLVMTRDAVPDLRVDCDENDANETRALQCRYLHGATFDVVGHLKQIQAARPRWMVLPRDADDVCCYPGPGMQCPSPIKPCE
ncbi:hypothetical protein [Vitiosangium sp. GDMCC 1.1324]|uniref:hypothetical protein n=1 Tax=Vitiosangium sp. (strain GDMCC 1.1324) TaxID=2138576 RepID=UPI000D39BE21|nr:hypothetical protein [Vitiosangium sp. GDMCC 1.1324]PTL77413.1 hypothetical protein DAT35_44200 [Vitiosangium sp. GDMCC 1.1324]